MKKKLLSLFLALTLALSLAAPAWAATPEEAQDSAQLLYNLGLFQGSGTNEDGSPRFALERAPTRAEAVTILVRLLGAEEAAQAQTWTTPFTDVPDWAQSYVGYAYAKGYTTGVEPTRFGSSTPVSTAQFLTLLLRALGYEDGKDFTWSTPWTLTDQLGITDGDYTAQTATFLRADAAVVSANALYAPKKGEDKTLLQDLLDSDDAAPLYVLSNSNGLYGASCMVYQNVLKDFADHLQADLILLPSSVHEVLLTPNLEDSSYEDLSSMVTSINRQEVSPEEQLSNQVYLFSRKDGSLKVVSNAPELVGASALS